MVKKKLHLNRNTILFYFFLKIKDRILLNITKQFTSKVLPCSAIAKTGEEKLFKQNQNPVQGRSQNFLHGGRFES